MNFFRDTLNQPLYEYDAELGQFMEAEQTRQEEHIELIASENYASKRVLEAQGSVLTCLLYTSPSPRDATLSRMPSSA